MWRDIDPRSDERERPQLSRGSGGDQDRHESQSSDLRDVFSRDLDLPRGTRRQPVRDRDRSVELRESEVRILATTGAFRVVPAKDLLDCFGASRLVGHARSRVEQDFDRRRVIAGVPVPSVLRPVDSPVQRRDFVIVVRILDRRIASQDPTN